jgi:hypothetical protein
VEGLRDPEKLFALTGKCLTLTLGLLASKLSFFMRFWTRSL